MEKLNKELREIKENIRKKNKWETQLADYEADLHEHLRIISSLERQLTSEQKDVRRLEGVSFTNFLATITGRKQDKLDKEKQEVVLVQLKLDNEYQTKQQIEQSIAELEEKIRTVAFVEEDYQRLLQTKARKIKASDSRVASQLYDLSDKESELNAYTKELYEAIAAGNTVQESLITAIDAFEKAKSWGALDMLGGGLLVTAAKHNRLSEATDAIHDVQANMRRFQKELLDVREEANLHIDMPGLLTFADFFFDGFIVDWVVQGRINQSLEQAEYQYESLRTILAYLENEVDDSEKKIQQLIDEQRMLLERYKG